MKLKSIAPLFVRPVVFSGVCLLGALLTAVPAHALSFNFIPAAGTSQQAIDGFAAAGTRWSSLFTDNVTVNIDIAFAALAPNILGQASSFDTAHLYTNVKTAMAADRTSAADFIAVANLQSASSLKLIMNRTSDNPNGNGNAGLFIDNNNSNNNKVIHMTSANAKALGLLAGNNSASDASISFSTAFAWDFDSSNGITAGTFDFVGVAAHEIGHALGFISGVDVLDYYSPVSGLATYSSSAFQNVSTLDLFRHSATSKANGAIDWAADNRTKYFSLDGGTTVGAAFSNGVNFGDGNQASHWKDSLGLGIMDPTASYGETLAITANDVQAFDAIGWNLASVPDNSSSLMLLGLGTAAVVMVRRRKASSASAA